MLIRQKRHYTNTTKLSFTSNPTPIFISFFLYNLSIVMKSFHNETHPFLKVVIEYVTIKTAYSRETIYWILINYIKVKIKEPPWLCSLLTKFWRMFSRQECYWRLNFTNILLAFVFKFLHIYHIWIPSNSVISSRITANLNSAKLKYWLTNKSTRRSHDTNPRI